MSQEFAAELAQPYRTTADVAHGLAAVETRFKHERDLRGVFVTAYLEITRALERDLAAGGFADGAWVERYLVSFGNLYRAALHNYEAGRLDAVPKAWRRSFDAARAREGRVLHHLVLGINAHINHDLPLALVEIGIDPNRIRRYADHTRVNVVLEASTAALKGAVSDAYAPFLRQLDTMVGTLDDDITNFSIPRAREHAWTFAVALTSARTDVERGLLRRALDEQAAVLARLVLAAPSHTPTLDRGVQFLARIDRVARRVPTFGLPGLFGRGGGGSDGGSSTTSGNHRRP